MTYRTKRVHEKIGKMELDLEVIANLDEAIDQLCRQAGNKITEAEALRLSPYYGVIWPSARGLSEHLERMGGWLKGKSVLEVGCGMALPSIVAAKLGAKVTATDFHPDVPPFVAKNASLCSVEFEFKALDWHDPAAKLGTYDFVIGSDVLYETSHPAAVAKVLASHCHKESHVLIADPGRTYLQAFTDEIRKQSFRGDVFIREVIEDPEAQDGKTKEVFLLSFQKV